VRNSLPVEGFRADNERDSSVTPKRRVCSDTRGRRALHVRRSGTDDGPWSACK
jgi:hypothetical protein